MGLSRRRFIVIAGGGAAIGGSGLLAGCSSDSNSASGSGADTGGPSTTAGGNPADQPTTLLQTIRKSGTGEYQKLVAGPGEDFTVRDDLGTAPGADRANDRRSILYFGQVSDTHVIDAQSPARLEYAAEVVEITGAQRAQDTLTTQVLDSMVRAVNAVPVSPVTGAAMAIAVVTGDTADSKASSEMHWYIDVFDGKKVTPNTGKKDEYQGVQNWSGTNYAWHPDDPSKDEWGMHGYPAYSGMLEAAIKEFETDGLDVPWLTVFGNHDVTWIGTFGTGSPELIDFAVGKYKIATSKKLGLALVTAQNPDDPSADEAFKKAVEEAPDDEGVMEVEPDDARALFTPDEYVKAHLDSPDDPGPAGHGFTQKNLDEDTTWWTRMEGKVVRFIGLDTCNHWVGADGSLPETQLKWMEDELKKNSSRYYDSDGNLQEQSVDDHLFIVLSHHTSWTMDNTKADPNGPDEKLYTGDELVTFLHRFPNCVAWVNGHTHQNNIRPQTSERADEDGFWEINTASCIDWAHQGRLIDIVDNRDGTLSMFTVTLDTAAGPDTSESDYSPTGLASISRELSANPWFGDPESLLGKVEDRNTELLIKAPFDLSKLSDDDLEEQALITEVGRTRRQLLLPAGLT